MEYKKIYEELVGLNETEQFLKEYYLMHHAFFPVRKLPEVLPDYKPSWEMGQVKYVEDPSGFSTAKYIELSEEDYFTSEYDVLVMKNLRYTKVNRHHHTFFEIMYVLNEECKNIIDGKENIMRAGDLCIIPPRVAHSIEVASEGVLINIMVKTSTFTEIFLPLLQHTNILMDFFNEILYSNNYRKYLMMQTGNDDVIRNVILEMYEEQKNGRIYYTSVMNGLLIILFSKLLQRHENSIEYPSSYVEKYDVVPRIVTYIQKNCKNLTLNDCAERFHFNPQYLSSLLKKHTGKTFSGLLTDARMKQASELLQTEGLSVNQVGILLGYRESAYFMKVFKKYYGKTPTAYRNGFENN